MVSIASTTDVFLLDETGIKTNTTANYGWSIKREDVPGLPLRHGKNYTILAAIGIDKIVEGILIDGTLDKPTFKYFMEDFLLPRLPKGSMVGMDNLSVHKHSFDMALYIKKAKIRYLQPYCQDLNPIENIWSNVKDIIRKMNTRNFDWHGMNEAFWEIIPDNPRGFYMRCGCYN